MLETHVWATTTPKPQKKKKKRTINLFHSLNTYIFCGCALTTVTQSK